MPGGDGTGPMGMGRMTGRGTGYCAGFATPGYANPVDFGFGLGGRHGFRKMFYATGLHGWLRSGQTVSFARAYEPNVSEKELLSRQAELLENQRKQVKKRLSNFKEGAE